MAVYTTRTYVEYLASADAVSFRLDDGADAPTIALIIADVIDGASADIDYYLVPQYDTTNFATNRWVKHACSLIALYKLCERRLETVPTQLQKRYEELLKLLEKIRIGAAKVPELKHRKLSGPVLSQPRVLLYPWPQVVTQREHSTGRPEGYTQVNDPLEPPAT